MESIFHERQEGSLCAQHCLNALLQGAYFTPVDLGLLAQQMDDEERLCMAECGEESEEYQRFLQQPSGNMDDSGYFSVQVISSALGVWNLELVPYTSTEHRARQANSQPCDMRAYICHYKDHWFTIRKLGNQWFNLNSLLSRPQLISDTYLSLFLAQLQQEGYSIFVVFGELPQCESDEILRKNPVIPTKIVPKNRPNDLEDLEKAIEMSLSDAGPSNSTNHPSNAMNGSSNSTNHPENMCQTSKLTSESRTEDTTDAGSELQDTKKLNLENETSNTFHPSKIEGEDERELQNALRLNLQSETSSVTSSMSNSTVSSNASRPLNSTESSNGVSNLPHMSSLAVSVPKSRAASSNDDFSEERELQKALRLSLQAFADDDTEDNDNDEVQLRKAMALSLECRSNTPSAPSTPCSTDHEEVRRKRLAFLDRTSLNGEGCSKADGL